MAADDISDAALLSDLADEIRELVITVEQLAVAKSIALFDEEQKAVTAYRALRLTISQLVVLVDAKQRLLAS